MAVRISVGSRLPIVGEIQVHHAGFLADFVAELTRYRRGFVRYDPAIANLRISGAFPIADTQRTLNMLVQTYPVRASGHLNGYWVSLSPA